MCAPGCVPRCAWSWGRGQTGASTVTRHRLAGEASPKRKFRALYLSSLEELQRAYVFYLALPVEETLFHKKQTSPSWKLQNKSLLLSIFMSPNSVFMWKTSVPRHLPVRSSLLFNKPLRWPHSLHSLLLSSDLWTGMLKISPV